MIEFTELKRYIKGRYPSLAEFCREYGISYQRLYAMGNTYVRRKTRERMADFLGMNRRQKREIMGL